MCNIYIESGARHWWDSIARSRVSGVAWTWNEFKELFLKNYYPMSVQNWKEVEFLTLTQDSMLLTKY